jgi:hypothetical protein
MEEQLPNSRLAVQPPPTLIESKGYGLPRPHDAGVATQKMQTNLFFSAKENQPSKPYP